MPKYKTEIRPGLVALYDIWPGNGAGQSYNLWVSIGPFFRRSSFLNAGHKRTARIFITETYVS